MFARKQRSCSDDGFMLRLSWEQIFKGSTGKVDNRSLGRILAIQPYSSHASRTKHSAQPCSHCHWSLTFGCKAILFGS